MTEKTPQLLLREAADRIAEADAMLDVREDRCGSCHGRHFLNFNHGKVHRAIEGLPEKLRTQADWLDTGDEAKTTAAR